MDHDIFKLDEEIEKQQNNLQKSSIKFEKKLNEIID